MQIAVTTKNLERRYDAATGKEAVQMFFDEVRADRIALDDLGVIGSWHDGNESHPFRIGPALFKCGLLSKEDLERSFRNAGLELEPAQIAAAVNADAWMVRQDSDDDGVVTIQ